MTSPCYHCARHQCCQACHDFQHTGVTNDFLVASGADLALRYNDKAPQVRQPHAPCLLPPCGVAAQHPGLPVPPNRPQTSPFAALRTSFFYLVLHPTVSAHMLAVPLINLNVARCCCCSS